MIDKIKVLYQMGVLMYEMCKKNADNTDDADLRRDANVMLMEKYRIDVIAGLTRNDAS